MSYDGPFDVGRRLWPTQDGPCRRVGQRLALSTSPGADRPFHRLCARRVAGQVRHAPRTVLLQAAAPVWYTRHVGQSLAEQLATQRRRVDFDTYDISVQQLLAMLEQEQIDIAPEYQRHFRWNGSQQSQLIESVFLGIPVPPLFMATNRDGSWEVVDGVQRLSTLVHFAGNDAMRDEMGLGDALRVTSLEKLGTLNEMTYDDLPQPLALQFALRPIKVVTLSDKSDLIVRFDLFERLNTGGVLLSNQEIRACVFRGEFNRFLAELAHSEEFETAVNLPKRKANDRSNEELVLRFFAFAETYGEFEHSVVGFLNDFMEKATRHPRIRQRRQLFESVFGTLAELFPNGIQRKSRTSTPVNLFEAVAAGAGVAYLQNGKLARPKSLRWVQGAELTKLTTGATNMRSMVTGRVEFAAKQFGWKP